MTPDCNHDTSPQNIGQGESLNAEFELYSDCNQDWLSLGCPSGWAGDTDWCDDIEPNCNLPECGYDLGDCDITCNYGC